MSKRMLRLAMAGVLACGALQALSAEPAAPADCEATADITPICIGHSAEDIERLPDNRNLLLSNYAGFDGTPGTLVLLDTVTQKTRQLYPSVSSAEKNATPGWGDDACPGAIGSALSPHGIHLSRRVDGDLQLLVVNHGSRESIELFQVIADSDGYQLRWRGCVPGPEGSFFNDVAALPGNEFATTQVLDKSDSDALAHAARGENTGYVLRWSKQQGFRKIDASDGSIPNGVQTSNDGHFAFVNYSGNGELRKIDLQKKLVSASITIRQPDNVSWTPDGKLLEISQLEHMDFTTCAHQKTGSCNIRFAVYEVDPDTLAVRKLLEHAGSPFGAATAAVQMGQYIYLGSFAGDRIARISAGRPTLLDGDEFVTKPMAADASNKPPCQAPQKYVELINAGQYDQIASLFASDASFITPTGEVLRGQAAIGNFYSKFLGRVMPQIVPISFIGDGPHCVMELAAKAKNISTGNYQLSAIDHFIVDSHGQITQMIVYLRPQQVHQ